MKKCLAILSGVLLAASAVRAGQEVQPKPVAKKRSASSKKSASSATAPVVKSSKPMYAELTIGELIAEDANRWSDKMDTRAAVGGFVTNIAKGDDGDTIIRVCENPRIDGMDRVRCIVAKCIPRLPCDVPQVGKPVTVKGITQYNAKVGAHWWEIHPIEELEK
jgi:hypothetical protein